MKIGIIDVGGGYRGVYAAGVLDYCLDENITFDLGIGVSAGSANLISFAAGQVRRNLRFYTEYGHRKEYVGPINYITKKSFINLDYAYSTLSNSDGEYPLNYPAFENNPMDFYVVATHAETGEAHYFDRSNISQDNYDVMKASCSIPVVCPPYMIDGEPYYDGALSDPVPIKKAFELGCDKVVLLLTKPETEIRDSETDSKIAALFHHHYPKAAEGLCNRAHRYNYGVMIAQQYAKEGKVLIVAPDDTCGASTLTTDEKILRRFYNKGYQDGKKIKEFINSPLNA